MQLPVFILAFAAGLYFGMPFVKLLLGGIVLFFAWIVVQMFWEIVVQRR